MFRTLAALAIAASATSLGALVSTAPAAGGKDQGFVDLFDGKDMKGWKFYPEALGKAIHVENGVIVVPGKPGGYFYTDKSYKNGTLRYDWQYKRPAGLEDDKQFNGNSGLLLFIQDHKVWPKSLEVQGMNLQHGRLLGVSGAKVTGAKFDQAALDKARHKVGEWNITEVVIKDGYVTAAVNGTPVASGKTDLTEGPFGFQSEGAEIHFKNIKIKPMH
jgi:hypothetical protein